MKCRSARPGFWRSALTGLEFSRPRPGLSFWEALPLAVLLVAAISAVLSIPALRVTGPYLAMVTIAFGFIVESVSIEWQDLTGGASGLAGIPAPFGDRRHRVAGLRLLRRWRLSLFHYFARSPLGLAMQATASAPAAARGIGIRPLPVRTAAFVLAAVAAGLAGGLQAALTGFIAPSSFPFSQSILFLLVVVVGGAGRTLGPLVGAAVVVLLPETAGGSCRISSAGFRRGVVDRALGRAGRDRRRPRASGDSRKLCPDTSSRISNWPWPISRAPAAVWRPKAFASRSAASLRLRASI